MTKHDILDEGASDVNRLYLYRKTDVLSRPCIGGSHSPVLAEPRHPALIHHHGATSSTATSRQTAHDGTSSVGHRRPDEDSPGYIIFNVYRYLVLNIRLRPNMKVTSVAQPRFVCLSRLHSSEPFLHARTSRVYVCVCTSRGVPLLNGLHREIS